MKELKTFEVVEHKQLLASELEPHPANNIGMSADDTDRLSDSLVEIGAPIQNLVVLERNNQGMHPILDGVQRWRRFAGKPDALLHCTIVRVSDPLAIVDALLCTGRTRTVGQRILMYIGRHPEALRLFQSDEGAERKLQNLKKGQCSPEDSIEAPGSQAERIAILMRCSADDCQRGLELEDCIDRKVTFATKTPDVASKPASASYMKMLHQIRAEILSGEKRIRNWKAAAAGKMLGSQPGTSGKAAADYQAVMRRSVASMGEVCKRWGKFSNAERAALDVEFGVCAKRLPESWCQMVVEVMREREAAVAELAKEQNNKA